TIVAALKANEALGEDAARAAQPLDRGADVLRRRLALHGEGRDVERVQAMLVDVAARAGTEIARHAASIEPGLLGAVVQGPAGQTRRHHGRGRGDVVERPVHEAGAQVVQHDGVALRALGPRRPAHLGRLVGAAQHRAHALLRIQRARRWRLGGAVVVVHRVPLGARQGEACRLPASAGAAAAITALTPGAATAAAARASGATAARAARAAALAAGAAAALTAGTPAALTAHPGARGVTAAARGPP